MNRKNMTLVVGMLLAISMMAAPSHVEAAPAATAKIGLLAPLTGALGSLGPSFENGAKLAIKDLNAMSLGTTFSLVVGDTETSADKAGTAAETLIAAGVIGMVGAAASSATLAATVKAKAAGIPVISYASTSPALTTEADDDLLFRVVPSDALQGVAAADLAEHVGLSKVAVIGIDDPYGQGLVNAFKAAWVAANGTIAAEVAYNIETTTDFSSQVTTIIDSAPDALFMVSFIDDGAAILNELAEQGFTGQILGTDGIASPTLLAVEGLNSTALGIMGTAPTLTGTTTFNAAFKAEYSTDPTIFVAEAYDATMIMGLAYIENDADMSAGITTVGTSYAGASGNITFDDAGDRMGGTYDIWQFQSATEGLSLEVVGSWTDNTLTVGTKLITTITSREAPAPLDFTAIFVGMMSLSVVAIFRRRKN
jgi:ABC-type branched-subunit amino acid transport system substrate-binding protein